MMEHVSVIEGERVEVRPPRFPLVHFEDLKPGTEASYLIDDLIPLVGLTVVWGPPKCGKSFWMFDVAMHVALGWDYRGRRVECGPVVYCAFEGASGFKKRAEAYRLRFLPEEVAPVPFYLSPAPADLVKDHDALVASIRVQIGESKPVLVVLDTLNRSLSGSESRDEDMSAYIRAADTIRAAFECAVVIVHHCGIDATRPRGHTSLAGAVDAQLAVKGGKGNPVIVMVEHMKDGEEGATITTRLDVVEVGMNDFGKVITSCVIVPAENALNGGKGNDAGHLSARNKRAIDALVEVLLDRGQPAPASFLLPPGVRVVGIELWREEMFRRSIIERDAKNPRQAFKQIKDSLAAKSRIGIRDEMVWSAHKEGTAGVTVTS